MVDMALGESGGQKSQRPGLPSTLSSREALWGLGIFAFCSCRFRGQFSPCLISLGGSLENWVPPSRIKVLLTLSAGAGVHCPHQSKRGCIHTLRRPGRHYMNSTGDTPRCDGQCDSVTLGERNPRSTGLLSAQCITWWSFQEKCLHLVGLPVYFKNEWDQPATSEYLGHDWSLPWTPALTHCGQGTSHNSPCKWETVWPKGKGQRQVR